MLLTEGGHLIDMRTMINFLLSRDFFSEKSYSFTALAFRSFCGLLMLSYGYGKVVNYDKYAADFFGDPIGIGDIPSLWLTIFAQTICPIALVLGFQTRIAAIILSFNMAVAVKFHFFDPFSIKVLPILFLGLYLIQILLGAGKYSLDYIFFCPNKEEFRRCERIGITLFVLATGIAWLVFSNYFTTYISIVLIIVTITGYLISFKSITQK